MNDTLALIGGAPRSGTTALLQLLNSDPHVFISSEENLLKSLQTLESLLDSRGRRARKMKGEMRELSPRETLTLDNIHRYNMDASAVWPTLRFVYTHHHQQLHPRVPLRVWGDKLPAYAQDIPKILALKDVRYLHITRNPLDVINSMVRRTEAAGHGRDWWRAITDFDAMVNAWAEAFQAIEKFEGEANVLHLHYEQLVFDFKQSNAQICQFLQADLSFENVLVDDPALHFDRAFLTNDMVQRILAHPFVAEYVKRYRDDPELPFVRQALEAGMSGICRNASTPVEGPMPELQVHGTVDLPIKVFVACTPAEWLPMRVLEFSIKETSRDHVELAPLYKFERLIPMPASANNRPRTPFSFQRFLIPELCNFEGKAIYLDADMLVFEDIAQVWNTPFDGCDLQTVREAGTGRRRQFSVMLLDCARLRWNVDEIVAKLDAGNLDYAGLMYEMRVAESIGEAISPHWNTLEAYDPPTTCLLHYTDMNTQPWISSSNPLGHLWVACLRRAVAAGFISEEEVVREVTAGHVRPSLLAQLRAGWDDCIDLPREMRRLDRGFVAPYRALRAARGRPWTSLPAALMAFVRRSYYRSPLPRIFG